MAPHLHLGVSALTCDECNDLDVAPPCPSRLGCRGRGVLIDSVPGRDLFACSRCARTFWQDEVDDG